MTQMWYLVILADIGAVANVNLKQLQRKMGFKQIKENRDLLIFVAALIAILIVGYQLAQVSILTIVALVILTYIVDFSLSKFRYVGDIGAAMINFVLVLLLLPSPAAIAVGMIVAYLSAKPDFFMVTLPLTQIALISMWMMSLLIF